MVPFDWQIELRHVSKTMIEEPLQLIVSNLILNSLKETKEAVSTQTLGPFHVKWSNDPSSTISDLSETWHIQGVF